MVGSPGQTLAWPWRCGTCSAVPPQPVRNPPQPRKEEVGAVGVSILLWVGRELLKLISFEVNLSGCPCLSCRAVLSEQTGSLLDETNPDVLQGCPLKRHSLLFPLYLEVQRKAELGLTFPCLHIALIGLYWFNNWGEIWTLLKLCPCFAGGQDFTPGFGNRWSRVSNSQSVCDFLALLLKYDLNWQGH